jgi:hypothetical protein
MASMHSILRDRAEFRALLLGFLLVASSFVVLVASVASDEVLRGVGLQPALARAWAVLVSVALFVLSLAELRLGYGLRAAGHREAALRLFQLKQRYRTELSGTVSRARLSKLNDEYQIVCSVLPAIPENQFHKLKMAHVRKVQLSKLIDLYPHVPLYILRARLLWEGLRGRTPPTG